MKKKKIIIIPAYIFSFLLTLVFMIFMIGCCTFSTPGYKGPVSDHFDGKRFHNQDSSEERGFGDMIKWMTSRDPGPWAEWTNDDPGPKPAASVIGDSLIATFIGHSTVLLQTEGLNILTDPVWSDRISPVSFIGPTRKRPPGIKFEDLPKIDIVLLSHNHYDHMDIPTLKKLRDKFNPLIITTLGNKQFLESEGIKNVVELDWWHSHKVSDNFDVYCVPARHFAMRGTCDRNTSLWGGFVIQTPGGPIFFAGDTGFGKHFKQIFDKFGKMRFSLLPIGAYRPRWFMKPMHINPADAVEAHKILQSETSLGIHFGSYKQADDGQVEPVTDLKNAMTEANISFDNFILPSHGKAVIIPKIAKNP